ncbi:MAG: ABC transporter permease [Spirochaetaceae bacterium]|jgi:lipopolysaccharide transport system permease protein|nr:ABC transporter permease [Spirochaetaceae bacterium]
MDWDLTVSSKHKLLELNLRELLRYRDLILMFFVRDFATVYKQTVLGPLWYIISPLCSTLVYAFAFGNIAGIGTDGIPVLLFYYGGTMLWSYFSNCLNSGANIFIANAGVFGKVYFPRLSVPIATTFGAVFKMLIQFAMLMAFLAYYLVTGSAVRPSGYALLFPVVVLWLGALGTGIGMIFSALTTKYRDLNHVLTLALGLAMYVTPVIYPLSQVPERFYFFFYINPVSAPMELFRIWFYGIGHVPPAMTISSIAVTVLAVFFGLVLFSSNERTFMDVI